MVSGHSEVRPSPISSLSRIYDYVECTLTTTRTSMARSTEYRARITTLLRTSCALRIMPRMVYILYPLYPLKIRCKTTPHRVDHIGACNVYMSLAQHQHSANSVLKLARETETRSIRAKARIKVSAIHLIPYDTTLQGHVCFVLSLPAPLARDRCSVQLYPVGSSTINSPLTHQ